MPTKTYYDEIIAIAHQTGAIERMLAFPADPNTVETAVKFLKDALLSCSDGTPRAIPVCWWPTLMGYVTIEAMVKATNDAA
ncbi:hypothetical protein FACS1894184_14020 [Clostridia bacterium]|nr:hypothetical protein FACS1894184_14020 [Clostridia bacterium]